MKQNGNYMLGTVMEIAEAISKNAVGRNGKISYKTRKHFKNCDFGVPNTPIEVITDLQIAFDDGDFPLFGIKRFDLGFGNPDLELFADYYGGGYGQYECIETESSIDECVAIIAKMILCEITIDGITKPYDDNTVIMAKWVND